MASNTDSVFGDIGRVDNLHDPEPFMNRRSVILGIIISFLIVSTLGAMGRLYIRWRITRNLGLDDLFVVLLVLTNIAAAVTLFILTSRGGLGQHFILLGLERMQTFLMLFYVVNALYIISTALIKLALLFQYLRMMEKGSRMRTVTMVFIVIISLWGTVFSILAWMPCLPVRAFWDWSVPQNTVRRYGYGSDDLNTIASTFFVHAAFNMFFDMAVFSIPMPLWLRSNPEKKTRWALLGLFVLGAIVNICSIFRLSSLVETRAATFPTFDPTWYGSAPIVLSAMEVHLATICAALPVFWPIVRDAWSNKRIIVTHEIVVKRESRPIPLDSFELTNGRETRSESTVSHDRPWENVHNEYRPMGHGLSCSHESSVSAAPKVSQELLVTRIPDFEQGDLA